MLGFITMELLVLQAAARRRFLQIPEVTDQALLLLKLLRALESPILLGNNASKKQILWYSLTCKWGTQMLPACVRPSDSYCDSPVSSAAFPPPSRAHRAHTSYSEFEKRVEASENLLHRWCLTYNSHENISAMEAKYIYKVLNIMTECALSASHHCIVIGNKFESMVNFIYLTSIPDYHWRWLQAGAAYLQ